MKDFSVLKHQLILALLTSVAATVVFSQFDKALDITGLIPIFGVTNPEYWLD